MRVFLLLGPETTLHLTQADLLKDNSNWPRCGHLTQVRLDRILHELLKESWLEKKKFLHVKWVHLATMKVET